MDTKTAFYVKYYFSEDRWIIRYFAFENDAKEFSKTFNKNQKLMISSVSKVEIDTDYWLFLNTFGKFGCDQPILSEWSLYYRKTENE